MNDQTKLPWAVQRPSTSDIVKSGIIAKATIRRPGESGVTIVAAFQLSHVYAFWFVFSARTARSPKRTWKLAKWIPARWGRELTLEEAITHAGTYKAPLDGARITKRYTPGKRAFLAIQDRALHPEKYVTTIPGIEPQTKYVNRKIANGRKGRFAMIGVR